MSFSRLFAFEQALAEFTGAPYVVVTDGCTNAIELCMVYDRVSSCEFSAFTYLSIPMLMKRLHIDYSLVEQPWIGEYEFRNTRIWDSARRLQRGMYRPGQMQCLSFGHTKPLELGKAGAILLDDAAAYQALSCMRSDGRDLKISPWTNQTSFKIGYHYCPTLETCEMGIAKLPLINQNLVNVAYPDCRKIIING